MAGQRTHVVVIGGGYAGTLAANRLQQHSGIDITLVNPRAEFVQRLRLHQFVAGAGEPTADYRALLGNGVRLVVDRVARIDVADRTLWLDSGTTVEYDYVIYAVGSTGATPASVPGATEFAYPVAELEQAARLRAAIDSLGYDAWLTVVGGGLTGIEAAAELAEQNRKVTLVCGGLLAPSFSPPARRSVANWLTRHDVGLVEAGVVAEVRRDAVVLADGVELPSAVTIWTAGFGVPDLATRSGLRTDTLGRLVTDETLTSLDDDRIVAAGDAAAPSQQPLRMSCYAAGSTGAMAADTVLSRIAGTQPAPLDLAFMATNVALGRRAATFQFTRKDDTAVDVYLGGRIGGRIAAAIKEAVTRGALWGIRREARKPGATTWPKGGTRAAISPSAPADRRARSAWG